MLTLRTLFSALGLALVAGCTARNDGAPATALEGKSLSLTVRSSGARGFATPAARIDLSGVELRGGGASTRLTTTAFGHASAMAPAHAAAVDERDGRVTLRRGALREWWRAVGSDLEFGYDVDARPDGEGPLRIVLGASSDVRVSSDGIAAFLGELRVVDLHARDTRGRELTARFVRDGASLAIEVDDGDAEYPLVIDPIVTSGTETKISTDAPASVFGDSLALSPDGKHLISKRVNGGSVIFFDEGPSGTWTSPGSVTFPATESGGTEDYNAFGDALAYYSDGTALIPDYRFNKGGLTWAGALFAYDATPKYQALIQPTDNKANNQFGFSVASSGTSVIVGARSTSGTAAGAYVFTKSGTTFTQQAKLAQPTGSNYFGWTVAIEGNIALVGALTDHAFAFRRTGTTWSAATELKPTEIVAADGYGTNFAIGGTTLLLSAPSKQVTTAGDGQVFVYRDTGTAFVREGVMFSVPPTGGAGGNSGSALAVSSDGNTAYVGAPAAAAGQGRVFVVTRTSGVWNVVRTLVPSDPATKGFGSKLALAGTRLAVGAPSSTGGGLVYIYDPVLGLPAGTCATALDCVSGFCVDGYCCDGACDAQCEACNVPGKEGKCSPVKGAPVGARPACAAGSSSPGCGNVCDGVTRNSCSLAGASFSCGTASCDSKGMLIGVGSCDGAGSCKPPAATDCAPYRCAAGACATSCTLDTDCADTARCVGGACVTGTSTGDAGPPTIGGDFTECKADSECSTGFCADGVCCDQPCKDKCNSCAVPGSVGKCVPESGIDLRGDCDAKSCTTTCQAGVCRPIRSGDQCAPSLCIDEQTAQGPSTCSAAGSSCSAATGTQSCAPFKCALGACLTSCVTTAQCAAGSVCDTSTQKCVTPPVEDDSGCAMGSSRGGASAALAILALAGLGLVRKRRR